MTTLNLQVAASTDDAWENAAGTVNTTGTTIGTLSTGNMWAGFRFTNVTVANAATINAGTQLQVNINSTSFDDLVCDVYCQAVDDAATFSASANDISGRSRTTAKTAVNATSIGVGWYAVSLTSVIQEIVNRPGWVSGNDIVVIIDGLSGISFQCRTWDHDTTLAAKLDIEYTTGSPQTLTGAHIASTTTLYAGAVSNRNTLTGAHIASGATLYAGSLHNHNTLTGAHIASTVTLYAGALTNRNTLTGAHIASTVILYPGALNTVGQVLTGAHIASTTTLYAGTVHRGALRIANVTHYEGAGISAASFDHETPAGDDRLLVLVAVYKDTAGVASLVFGSEGSGDGEFLAPYGIAVSSDGFIYVTDFDNARVQKFDSTGSFVAEWGSPGTGDGEFYGAQGMAVAPDGAVYVSDYDLGRIQKFDPDGTFITKWGTVGSGDGQFDVPWGIAVAPDGSVYVADGNDRIQKFDPAGTFITKWGSPGSGDGQMVRPTGIAVGPDGMIYVVDSNRYRIQKFDPAGAFVTQWGSNGEGDGQFAIARGIAVAPDGSVYVADTVNHRIQKFDAGGTFLAKWGSAGSGDGQFWSVNDVAVGADGSVYTIDSGNDRIQKFVANLKLNTTRYGGEEMQVGPLVDAGSYFVAFYTLENPPVGAAEIAFAAPTEPDVIMLTAISLNGVETYSTDYTGPNAGMAEQETHTTQLQVSHNRAYPTNTLSLWAALYESAGTTLTGASGNSVWLQRNAGNLRLVLGLRPIPDATSGSITFGATASPAVSPLISGVLHIEGKRGNLAGAFIGPVATLYPGAIVRPGQYLQGAHIGSTAAVFAGAVVRIVAAAHIEAGTVLYAPAVIQGEPGPTQFLYGAFIGMGQPGVLNGAFIDAATELFAPALLNFNRLEGAFIEEANELFAPTVGAPVDVRTGRIYPPTVSHV